MRVFTPESPYYTPLPRNSMDSLFKQLFSPFAQGMSSTFAVKKGCGGGKALTRFLLLHLDEYAARLEIPVSTVTHSYIPVDAPRDADDPEREFLVRLGNACHEVFGTKSPPYALTTIRDLLDEMVRDREFVFVVRGVDVMADYGVDFWDELGSLMLHTGRVHFLSIFYGDDTGIIDASAYGGFREYLTQNVVPFGELGRKDALYAIRRWGYTLDLSFTNEQREEIIKQSGGCPALIKAYCMAVSRQSKEASPEDHPLVVSAKKRLGLKDTDGGLLRKWREVLSEPEYRVMVLLYESRGDVDRSRIASALWGIESDERYSDGAITQAVRRIRKKLLAIPGEKARIRTVYGKGYRLEL